MARWIHSWTTLRPDTYIDQTKNQGIEEINVAERYSINCIFFKKEMWNEIDDGGNDDELMVQKYCIENRKIAVANLSIPICHLFFYTQRKENKDLLPKFREVYENWCALSYPISIMKDRENAIEDRLRYLEQKFHKKKEKNVISRLKNMVSKFLAGKQRQK